MLEHRTEYEVQRLQHIGSVDKREPNAEEFSNLKKFGFSFSSSGAKDMKNIQEYARCVKAGTSIPSCLIHFKIIFENESIYPKH